MSATPDRQPRHARWQRVCRACLVVALGIAANVTAGARAAENRPAHVPLPEFHLTARPFEPSGAKREDYLEVIEGICRYLARLQDERGAIVDPYLGREHQYTTPYFAYPVGVLLQAGRCDDLRAAGVRAMEHATRCLAAGSEGIPDRHGEFFVAPLTEALALYRNQVDEATWQTWRTRLQTPLARVMEDQHGRINNWRTYAMKGQWLRRRPGWSSGPRPWLSSTMPGRSAPSASGSSRTAGTCTRTGAAIRSRTPSKRSAAGTCWRWSLPAMTEPVRGDAAQRIARDRGEPAVARSQRAMSAERPD